MDQYTDHGFCNHVIKARDGITEERVCENRARFHYRAQPSGIVVRLCGRHAGAAAHRWKNPRPIHEVV